MWRGTDSVPVEVIERMAAGGMAGLEVDHPDHDDGMRTRYRDLARGLGLIATGASDCHGARFGFRLGSETTDAQRVDALRERRPAARPAAGPA